MGKFSLTFFTFISILEEGVRALRPRPGTRKGINRAAAWRSGRTGPIRAALWVLRILRRYKLSEFRRLKREPDPPRQTAYTLAADPAGGPSGPQDAFKAPLDVFQEASHNSSDLDALSTSMLRAPRRPKTPPRRSKMPPRCPRSREMEPKGRQVGTKIASKIYFNRKKANTSRIL